MHVQAVLHASRFLTGVFSVQDHLYKLNISLRHVPTIVCLARASLVGKLPGRTENVSGPVGSFHLTMWSPRKLIVGSVVDTSDHDKSFGARRFAVERMEVHDRFGKRRWKKQRVRLG